VTRAHAELVSLQAEMAKVAAVVAQERHLPSADYRDVLHALEAEQVIGGLFFMRMVNLDEAVDWASRSDFVKHGAVEIRELWSYLDFIEDKREWNGTRVTFDIARKGDQTEVRFTHAGLVPAHQCYDACSNAWGSYIGGSLRSLIATGKGRPNPEEKTRRQVAGV
jgi:hypothetical protein